MTTMEHSSPTQPVTLTNAASTSWLQPYPESDPGSSGTTDSTLLELNGAWSAKVAVREADETFSHVVSLPQQTEVRPLLYLEPDEQRTSCELATHQSGYDDLTPCNTAMTT